MNLKRSLVFFFFTLTCLHPALAEDQIHIWIKAFIPNSNPSNPSYVRPVPGRPGKTMIPSPTSGSEWFMTNHRGFSSNPKAEAKVTTEFLLVVRENSASIEKAEGRPLHQPGKAQKVNGDTGELIGKALPATMHVKAIGGPHVAGSKNQVIVQVSASNPFAPAGVSPSIDYSMDLTYDSAKREITFRASVGKFPAYEAYASRNGGPPHKLFAVMPSGESVWSLYEFGTGIGDRALTGTVKID